VLQTPAALLLVAWVVGLASQRSVGEEEPAELPGNGRVFALASVLLFVAVVPAARRVASVEVAGKARGSEDFDRAALLDPGDIGLRLVAAESWIGDGRCDRARTHLDAVGQFSPASPARSELMARCSTVSTR
jgi:hypothetical protein